MCAKVSQIMVRKAAASSSADDKTPKRQTGRPSKTPSKPTAKSGANETPHKSPVTRQAAAAALNNSPFSSPDSDNSSTSTDFLGRPLSDERSEFYSNSEEGTEEQSPQPSKVTRPSSIGRKQPRKQSNPKKSNRKNKIRSEIKKFQNSTNLLVPRLPFQR